jgi:hypothetical protein
MFKHRMMTHFDEFFDQFDVAILRYLILGFVARPGS